jgi:CubicO group peptidase (beta-lactamase class C family)
MGGIETCAVDYARWLTFLLSAWPARDDAQMGPVARATLREIVEGSNFVAASMRHASIGGTPCRVAHAYGMGWNVIEDCDLGRILSHSGGYPGYGSNALLLPDRGVGLFAFANRTYAFPAQSVFKAALEMKTLKRLPERAIEAGPRVLAGYATARAIWAAGGVDGVTDHLAINFLMDRDAAHWATELARLRTEVGACAMTEPVSATSAMAGEFTWTCEHGRIVGRFLLAPTARATLQSLDLKVATP